MPVLERLVSTGVKALKLEGRTRSALYLGLTVDIYRHALDRLARGDREGLAQALPAYIEQLEQVSPRPFSTHFYTGDQDRKESYLPKSMEWDGAPRFAGKVIQEGLLELKNGLNRGAKVVVRDRGLLSERVTLDPLLSEEGEELERALHGQRIRLPAGLKCGPGALAMMDRGVGAGLVPSRAGTSPAPTG